MSSKRTIDERLIEKNEQLNKALETAKQYQAQVKQLEKRKKEPFKLSVFIILCNSGTIH